MTFDPSAIPLSGHQLDEHRDSVARARRALARQHGSLTALSCSLLPLLLAVLRLTGVGGWGWVVLVALAGDLLFVVCVRPLAEDGCYFVGVGAFLQLFGLAIAIGEHPGAVGASALPLLLGGPVLLLSNALVYRHRYRKARLGDNLLPLPGHGELCERLLAACSRNHEVEAYRRAVVALGRELTVNEAEGMVAWVAGVEACASRLEQERRREVACAMLKSGDDLTGVALE